MVMSKVDDVGGWTKILYFGSKRDLTTDKVGDVSASQTSEGKLSDATINLLMGGPKEMLAVGVDDGVLNTNSWLKAIWGQAWSFKDTRKSGEPGGFCQDTGHDGPQIIDACGEVDPATYKDTANAASSYCWADHNKGAKKWHGIDLQNDGQGQSNADSCDGKGQRPHVMYVRRLPSEDSKPADPKPVACKGGCSVSASGKAPSFWGKSDSELGIPSGVTIEEFADAKLAAGFALVWSDDKGSFDGQPALTTVDDLLTTKKDPGTAFSTGYWGDGQAVTNFARGKNINYGDASGWRRLRLQFSEGVSYVGFSMQQTDQADELFLVNKGLPSEKVLHRNDVSNLGAGKDGTNRDGYVMFSMADGCCGIKTIDLGIGNGDGFAVDHITFKSLSSSEGSKPAEKPVK
jgi:hypothetical protein